MEKQCEDYTLLWCLSRLLSKEQKMMSPLQWWVRQLTSGTRIRIARSPRPRGGLLLWEAGIMTRVTQTIYNPGNAELWLVRSANAGLWLAGTWSSISSKNVFKINHSYTKKLHVIILSSRSRFFLECEIFLLKWLLRVSRRRSCICSVQEQKLAEFPFLLI